MYILYTLQKKYVQKEYNYPLTNKIKCKYCSINGVLKEYSLITENIVKKTIETLKKSIHL